MTTFDRFDPFERRITEAIDEIAAARPPAYLTDILRQTARTSQRPRWTFPERWLPVDTTFVQPVLGRRASLRPLIVLALLTALVVGAIAAYVGSRQRLPAPFGPAANGQIAYTFDGDLYVRDTLQGNGRLLIGGEGNQHYPYYSPDGAWLAYLTSTSTGDEVFVARADGSDPRHIAHIPPRGNSYAAWAPDSRRFALIHDVDFQPTLSIADTATGQSSAVPLDGMVPLDVTWRPPAGDELLIRARITPGEEVGLFTLRPDGGELKSLGLPGKTGYGPAWTLTSSQWSPDGKTIAFNYLQPDPARDEWYYRTALVDPDGSNLRVLPPVQDTPLFNQAWPVYSPDGKWIVMESWMTQADDTAVNQLAIAPADGSGPTRAIGPEVPGVSLVKTWAPDGSRVILSLEGEATLYAVDPVTGDAELLPFKAELPDWQRVALP